MNRYDIVLGKKPPLEFRLQERLRNSKLMDALCETKGPLIGDMDLFEKYEGTDLSFWYGCLANESPNLLGTKLMARRNDECNMRIIDRAFLDQMAKAAKLYE